MKTTLPRRIADLEAESSLSLAVVFSIVLLFVTNTYPTHVVASIRDDRNANLKTLKTVRKSDQPYRTSSYSSSSYASSTWLISSSNSSESDKCEEDSLCRIRYRSTKAILEARKLQVVASNDIPTSSPASGTGLTTPAISPIAGEQETSLPTLVTKCYICGSPDRWVSQPFELANFVGAEFNCTDLEMAGRIGYIPQDSACPLAQIAADASCACQDGPLVGSFPTTSPTSSPQPTTTTFPTSSNQPCNLCGSAKSYIVNLNSSITVFDKETDCRTFSRYAQEVGLPTSVCLYMQQQLYGTCGCSDISSAPTPVLTLFPTKSEVPTITISPSFSEKCQLCPDPKMTFNSSSSSIETLNINGYLYSCSTLQRYADERSLDSKLCQVIQKRNQLDATVRDTRSTRVTDTGCTCVSKNTEGMKSSPESQTAKETSATSFVSPSIGSTTKLMMFFAALIIVVTDWSM